MSTLISVEISLYPLTPDYKPPIRDFIARLKANPQLKVISNTMSTQIQGDYDAVWDTLKREMRPNLTAHIAWYSPPSSWGPPKRASDRDAARDRGTYVQATAGMFTESAARAYYLSAMSDITAIPSASAVQIATNAIRKSQVELRKDASVVANPNETEMRDTVSAMVDSRQQVLYTRAAAKIISTEDQMTKSLLDIQA
ncbi:MAG: YkoF family thiamine/hydroxymethylpyrimidine-binding protein [Pseudomonadota bacterium]